MRSLSAYVILIIASVAASNQQIQQTLYIPATSEATTFTAPADGNYSFTITGGAAMVTPPNVEIEHPDWHGWNTMVIIYKDRPTEWGGGPHAPEHPNPRNWDISVGQGDRQPNYGAAENAGRQMSNKLFLRKDEYATLLVSDSKGYFHDNSGGVRLLVSLLSDAAQVEADSDGGSACDTFDLLGEGKELIDNFSGTETVRFGWEGDNYRALNTDERVQYEPGFHEAFGEQWDFAPLGVIRTGWEAGDFGTDIGIWRSERYGEARGRILCDQTGWDPSAGPRIGETFRLVGTVDKPFSAPFIPDTSSYDIAWVLYQTVTDVKKSRDSGHGEYVSQVTWELNGSVHAKPKAAFVKTETAQPGSSFEAATSETPELTQRKLEERAKSYIKDNALVGEGALMFNDFEAGVARPSPLLPAAGWHTDYGRNESKSECHSSFSEEPHEGANGTSASVKWNFRLHDSWAAFGVLPTGSWDKTLDLSRVSGISFYVKSDGPLVVAVDWGFRPKAAPDQILHNSIQVKPEATWKKMTIAAADFDRAGPMEWDKIVLFEFSVWNRDPIEGNIWIDEIMFHMKEPDESLPLVAPADFTTPAGARRYPRWMPLIRIDRLRDYLSPLWVYWYFTLAALLVSGHLLRNTLRRVYYIWRPLPEGRLIVLKEPSDGKTPNINIWFLARKLKKRRLVIGSAEGSDIHLPHDSVEARHAEIFARRSEDGVNTFIKPIGAGRVTVGGMNEQRMTLRENADVKIGDFRFRYEAPTKYRQAQARYRNGRLVEGVPATWDIGSDGFVLLLSRSRSWRDSKYVRFEKLKGVYFTQDWDEDVRKKIQGEKSLRDNPTTIHFQDGEACEGYLMGNYQEHSPRFYFFPKDQSGETVYILVERSSVKSIEQMERVG